MVLPFPSIAPIASFNPGGNFELHCPFGQHTTAYYSAVTDVIWSVIAGATRACQVFCVWGSFISLEVGVDSLGVSEGQLGERLLPVGRHCSLNELARC